MIYRLASQTTCDLSQPLNLQSRGWPWQIYSSSDPDLDWCHVTIRAPRTDQIGGYLLTKNKFGDEQNKHRQVEWFSRFWFWDSQISQIKYLRNSFWKIIFSYFKKVHKLSRLQIFILCASLKYQNLFKGFTCNRSSVGGQIPAGITSWTWTETVRR